MQSNLTREQAVQFFRSKDLNRNGFLVNEIRILAFIKKKDKNHDKNFLFS